MNKKTVRYDACTNKVRCKKEDKKKLDYCYKILKEWYYSGKKEYIVNLEELRNQKWEKDVNLEEVRNND